MAFDPVVIYDPTLELAAIVNLDDLTAWGPVYKGPDAQDILQGFIDAAPFDVTILDTDTAKALFWSLGQAGTGEASPESGQAQAGTVDDAAGGLAANEGLATAEAHAAGTVPDIQPHDADAQQGAPDTASVEVGQSSDVTQVTHYEQPVPEPVKVSEPINCGLCNADGNQTPDPTCIACGGSGKLARVG